MNGMCLEKCESNLKFVAFIWFWGDQYSTPQLSDWPVRCACAHTRWSDWTQTARNKSH